MSEAKIIIERIPILKISFISDERFSKLHYIKDIRTHTHTHTDRWTDGQMWSSHKTLFSS
jgi:hypothetical protein